MLGGIFVKPCFADRPRDPRVDALAGAAPAPWLTAIRVATLVTTPVVLATPPRSPAFAPLPAGTPAPAITLGGKIVTLWSPRVAVPWAPPPLPPVAAGQMRRTSGAAARLEAAASPFGPPAKSSTGRAMAEQAARGWRDEGREALLKAIGASMSATNLGQVIQQARAEVAVTGANLTAFKDYCRVCTKRGEAHLPITPALMLALAADYVGVRGNQSAGISALLTRVKSYALTTGLWHMSADDETRMRADARFLAGRFPYIVKAAEPITFVEIDMALAWLRKQPRTLWTLQMAAMMTVMHGGLLRGSEATDGHLLACDVVRVFASEESGRGGFFIKLLWRKMAKRNSDERMDSTCIVARTDPKRCPAAALDAYLDAAKLAPLAPLFVGRARDSGRVTDTTGVSYAAFTKDVKFVFQQAGVKNAYSFTGRGFRSGGHTDLYRESEDFELVGLLGGWKSLEAQRLYLRMKRLSFKHLSEVFT